MTNRTTQISYLSLIISFITLILLSYTIFFNPTIFQRPSETAGALGVEDLQGPAGVLGVENLQGPAGAQGFEGKQGPAGAQGVEGKPGPASYYAQEVYEKTKSGVVFIKVYTNSNDEQTLSVGSGFIYDKNGHIVTNEHVVRGGSDFIIVFFDGTMSRAEIIGIDSWGDLAVLRANLPNSVKELELESKISVGEHVFALGSPAGLVGSITAGVISQTNRTGITILPMIQTDASLNPGNSGGPLINSDGKVIGINARGYREGRQYEALGFAIPASIAKIIIPDLIEKGFHEHPYIGIYTIFLDLFQIEKLGLSNQVIGGRIIQEIIQDSAADKSELQTGDIILTLGGHPLRAQHDISYILQHFFSPGDNIPIEVFRNGKAITVELTLGKRQ